MELFRLVLVHPALTLIEIYPTTAKLNHSFEFSDVVIVSRSRFIDVIVRMIPFVRES